jgi:hypothetical protein
MPMTKTFTQDELIRYIYHETSDQESKEIENALICDGVILELYKKLKNTIQQLDKIEESPSGKTIDKILDYSKSVGLNSIRR